MGGTNAYNFSIQELEVILKNKQTKKDAGYFPGKSSQAVHNNGFPFSCKSREVSLLTNGTTFQEQFSPTIHTWESL